MYVNLKKRQGCYSIFCFYWTTLQNSEDGDSQSSRDIVVRDFKQSLPWQCGLSWGVPVEERNRTINHVTKLNGLPVGSKQTCSQRVNREPAQRGTAPLPHWSSLWHWNGTQSSYWRLNQVTNSAGQLKNCRITKLLLSGGQSLKGNLLDSFPASPLYSLILE